MKITRCIFVCCSLVLWGLACRYLYYSTDNGRYVLAGSNKNGPITFIDTHEKMLYTFRLNSETGKGITFVGVNLKTKNVIDTNAVPFIMRAVSNKQTEKQ